MALKYKTKHQNKRELEDKMDWNKQHLAWKEKVGAVEVPMEIDKSDMLKAIMSEGDFAFKGNGGTWTLWNLKKLQGKAEKDDIKLMEQILWEQVIKFIKTKPKEESAQKIKMDKETLNEFMDRKEGRTKKISLNLKEVYFIMESLEMRSYDDIYNRFENCNRNGFMKLIGKLHEIKGKLNEIKGVRR